MPGVTHGLAPSIFSKFRRHGPAHLKERTQLVSSSQTTITKKKKKIKSPDQPMFRPRATSWIHDGMSGAKHYIVAIRTIFS